MAEKIKKTQSTEDELINGVSAVAMGNEATATSGGEPPRQAGEGTPELASSLGFGPGVPTEAPPSTPQFSNEPTTADNIGNAMATGNIMATPAYQQYLANEQKLTMLNAQPTYTNKKGEQVQGMQDKDGRWRSGLKGLIAGAAQNFSGGGPVRDWNDLYSRLSGSIATGVGGALVPEWNEQSERQQSIQSLSQEQERLKHSIGFQSQMATQETNRIDKAQDNDRQAETLRTKKRADFFRRKKAFDPTKASDADVRELAEFGETPMSVGHYDFTKADVRWVNGKAFQWKDGSWIDSSLPEKSNEMLVEYKIKDQDGVSSTYMVPQQKAAQFKTDMIRAGMQIEAANERQRSSQQFSEKQMYLRQQMQKELSAYNAALAEKKMDKAEEIKGRLMKLENEYRDD